MSNDALINSLYGKLVSESAGTPTAAMLQSDINRGVLPGQRSEWAEEMSPTELALLDRYAWGQQGGLGGIPVAVGYEALKAASQTPMLGKVLPAVASAMGFEDTGNQFQQDETSSPASWANIRQYLRGALNQ